MTFTLDTYDPINTLKPVADNIWIVDGPVIRMSYSGGSLPFPTRMVVIRLETGDLFLWSPIRYDAALAGKVSELGRVAHLISPNKIHYAGISEWKQVFPDAISWASPGVRERAESQHIDIVFDRDLGDEPPAAWADDIGQTVMRGSRMIEEVIFFHRSSRTLILADLIERFDPDKTPRRWHWLYRLAGVMERDAQIPLDLRLTWLGRKERAQPALKQMLDWDPARIIIAHGNWFEGAGAQQICRSFRWLGSHRYAACGGDE